MKRRSLKDLQRKKPTKELFYCPRCGMPLSEKKELCSGCIEAQGFAEMLKEMSKNE